MAKKTTKNVNPVDAEFTEIMNETTDVQVQPKEEVIDFTEKAESKSLFEQAVKEVAPVDEEEEKELTGIKNEKSNNPLIANRYIQSECLYKVNSESRPDMVSDFSEFFIDVETILSLERVFPERLKDFGMEEDEVDELQLMEGCIVHCSAFTDEIIVMDYDYENMIEILTSYRQNQK